MGNSIDFQGDANYNNYEKYVESDGELNPVGDIRVMGTVSGHQRQVDFMDGINDTLVDLQSDYESAVSELNAKIADCDDPVTKQRLKGSLDQLNDAWTMISQRPPGMHREMGEFREMWNSRIENMRNSIVDASVELRPDDEAEVSGTAATPISEPPSTEGMGAESGDSDSSMDLTDIDVDNMVNLMTTDPQAAMAELKKLPAEDRSIAMQMITQNLQNMNQMFSMMSNVTKTLHDTSKAIINNMRV